METNNRGSFTATRPQFYKNAIANQYAKHVLNQELIKACADRVVETMLKIVEEKRKTHGTIDTAAETD